MPRRRLHRHEYPRGLSHRVHLTSNYDLSDARLPGVVVLAYEPHCTIAGSGVVPAHKRNPRLRHDGRPHVTYRSSDRKLAVSGVAFHHGTVRLDGKVVGALRYVHLLVADRDPSSPRTTLTHIRRDNIQDFPVTSPRITLEYRYPHRIRRHRRPGHVAVGVDGDGLITAVRAEQLCVVLQLHTPRLL